MFNSRMAERRADEVAAAREARPELRWIPVTGADGRTHMEAQWIVPLEPRAAASAA